MGADVMDWFNLAEIVEASNRVAKRYRSFVDREDLQSEITVWLLEDPGRARQLFDGPRWFRQRCLRTVAERYARTEKAESLGYLIEDEFFYTMGLVQSLLPDALDETSTQPTGRPHDQPKVTKQPGTGNEWVTMVADVRQALKLLSERDLDLVATVFGPGALSLQNYAEMQGWDYLTAWRAQRRALGRLVDLLGGTIPWTLDVDQEPPEGAPGDSTGRDGGEGGREVGMSTRAVANDALVPVS